MSPSSDFYLRVSLEQLRSLRFALVLCGVDEDDDSELAPDAQAAQAGYTEWASDQRPSHSIGWDWVSLPQGGLLALRRHSIRTNLMLLTEGGEDAGRAATEEAIEALIAEWDWPQQVFASVS